MKTIWKFDLLRAQAQTLKMPDGGQILSIQKQGEMLCLWALVDTAEPQIERILLCLGTGQSISTAWDCLPFLATVIDGEDVWHFFELLRRDGRKVVKKLKGGLTVYQVELVGGPADGRSSFCTHDTVVFNDEAGSHIYERLSDDRYHFTRTE